MITAPVPAPAHRPAREALVRAALDRIDELLDPVDAGRGLGSVLATVRHEAQGIATRARLALAARCVAHRLRQEATEQLLACIESIPAPAAPAGVAPFERRLRRKVRELRVSIELRLPGRLLRADAALQALAQSTVLTDTLRGFVLTSACRQHALDPAWVGRLEALSPLLQPPRSPLSTLTATCAHAGLRWQARGPADRGELAQRLAVCLFQAFAGAAEALAALRARLAASTCSHDRLALAALDSGAGLSELACLAIGSTPVRPTERHGRLCSLLAAALASDARHLVDQALQPHLATRPEAIRPILDLLCAWTRAAQGARPGRPPAAPAGLPARLRQAIDAYLDAD